MCDSTIKEVIYLKQPDNSRLCGQTCLAMAFNKSIDEICSLLKTKGGTYNTHIYKTLDHYNVKYRYRRITKKNRNIPDDAIVKIGFTDSKSTHWIYKTRGYFFDPYAGVVKDYEYIDYNDVVLFISYIQLLR